jgi:nucleotide-binding universal stress UspA family protein
MADAPTYRSLPGGNILVATDGKGHSEKAILAAIDLAKALDSKLYVLMVITPSSDRAERAGQIKEAKKKLNDIVDLAADRGAEVTALLEGGSPYDTIIQAAERLDAAAVVVGTSEKAALDRVLIGSVSEYVVRHSPRTVVVVK